MLYALSVLQSSHFGSFQLQNLYAVKLALAI